MSKFKSQELVNMAWAFAVMGHLNEKLCNDVLARAAEQRMSMFNV